MIAGGKSAGNQFGGVRLTGEFDIKDGGVTGYQVWIGAPPSTMTMEQALSADQSSCILSSVPKRIYYMDVRAIDAANNASVSKPAKVTVTTSLPVNNFAMSASSSDLLAWSASAQTPFALASNL